MARTLWDPAFQESAKQACDQNGVKLLYLVVSGSHAYGTNVAGSDIDLRGVFLPSRAHLFGVDRIEDIKFGEDGKMCELRSYIRKLEAGTPNLLDWLFVPQDCILYHRPEFDPISAFKQMFVTQKLRGRILGYAQGQLHKMGQITRDSGEKRKSLIAKYGYDTKNAMHLMRLLYLGLRVAQEHVYCVRDRSLIPLLLEIRAGKFSLKQIVALADLTTQAVASAFKRSDLRAYPKHSEVNTAVQQVFQASLASKLL